MNLDRFLIKANRIDNGKAIFGTGITDFLNVYPDKKGLWLWSRYSWIEVDPKTVIKEPVKYLSPGIH